jgi:hypothetical protein
MKKEKVEKIKKEKPTCDICTNNYNNTFRKPLKCQFCPYTACNYCCRQFILTKASPQCMNCKTIWTDDFLFSVFPKTWVDNDLRDHLDNVLYQQEKSLFPLAMEEIEKDKMRDELNKAKKKRVMIEIEINKINSIIQRFKNTHRYLSNDNLFIIEQQKLLSSLEKDYNDILFIETNLSEKIGAPIITKFRRPCPNESCKGFISLNNSNENEEEINTSCLNCALCNSNFCSRCREDITNDIKRKNHICDKNTIKSLQLIDKDTKQCPSCRVPVYKISGCDQMFCVNCKSAFNWNTLEIETGRIHNPHYFEWLRQNNNDNTQQDIQQNNRRVLDDGCGNRITNWIDTLTQIVKKNYPSQYVSKNNGSLEPSKDVMNSSVFINTISSIIRIITHMQEVEMPNIPDQTVRHLQVRVDFLRNKLQEEDWKNKVSINERVIKKNILYRQILETFLTIFNDILHRIWNSTLEFEFDDINEENKIKYSIEYKKIPKVILEFHNARYFFNELSRNFSLRFNKNHYISINHLFDIRHYTPTVKEECPIDEFKKLHSKELKIYDWMDTLEKELITFIMSKYEIFKQIKIFMTETIGKNLNKTNFNHITSLVKSFFENNEELFLHLDKKREIRANRKIRNNVIESALYTYTRYITEVMLLLYTNIFTIEYNRIFLTISSNLKNFEDTYNLLLKRKSVLQDSNKIPENIASNVLVSNELKLRDFYYEKDELYSWREYLHTGIKIDIGIDQNHTLYNYLQNISCTLNLIPFFNFFTTNFFNTNRYATLQDTFYNLPHYILYDGHTNYYNRTSYVNFSKHLCIGSYTDDEKNEHIINFNLLEVCIISFLYKLNKPNITVIDIEEYVIEFIRFSNTIKHAFYISYSSTPNELLRCRLKINKILYQILYEKAYIFFNTLLKGKTKKAIYNLLRQLNSTFQFFKNINKNGTITPYVTNN